MLTQASQRTCVDNVEACVGRPEPWTASVEYVELRLRRCFPLPRPLPLPPLWLGTAASELPSASSTATILLTTIFTAGVW